LTPGGRSPIVGQLCELVGGEMSKPLDKILCGGKYYRYVVACMHNCPHPHYCRELWAFFNAIGRTPAEYYNVDGIGEQVMRRVVFDCDRCGRRSLPEVFSSYTEHGESEEYLLDEGGQAEAMDKMGYGPGNIARVTFTILRQMEELKGWQHYCRGCFRAITDGVAVLLRESRSGRKKPAPRSKAGGEEPKAAAAGGPADTESTSHAGAAPSAAAGVKLSDRDSSASPVAPKETADDVPLLTRANKAGRKGGKSAALKL